MEPEFVTPKHTLFGTSMFLKAGQDFMRITAYELHTIQWKHKSQLYYFGNIAFT